jgi:phospholipid transport system substrate-binding protein
MSYRTGLLALRLVMVLCACLALPRPAMAGPPAESFVSENIQAGLAILSDKQLTGPQRNAHFQDFLLGITDMKRTARFTLGKYAVTASAAQQDAFAAAFQNYAVTVYQSYFTRYSGQKLAVLRTTQRSPSDFVVATAMTSPEQRGEPPLEIDFRVRTDGATPVIVDIGVAGVWLALAEQADFEAVLDRNGGDISALIVHLNAAAAK